MDILTVVSEKGGVGKTTCTVGLARALVDQGMRVGVIDLDPRATTTTWLDVEPRRDDYGHPVTVSAILAHKDPDGLAPEIAVPSPWHPGIHVVPASRDLATIASASPEYGESRLARAVTGWDIDTILIDSPNRQGGFLIRTALTASTRVLYTATPDEDGREGVEFARKNRAAFCGHTGRTIPEAGIIITRWPDTIPTRDARTALDALRSENPGMVLTPLIPERVIVRDARTRRIWWGGYDKGDAVRDAFKDLAGQLWPALERTPA